LYSGPRSPVHGRQIPAKKNGSPSARLNQRARSSQEGHQVLQRSLQMFGAVALITIAFYIGWTALTH
jgi:hypothetical protein